MKECLAMLRNELKNQTKMQKYSNNWLSYLIAFMFFRKFGIIGIILSTNSHMKVVL